MRHHALRVRQDAEGGTCHSKDLHLAPGISHQAPVGDGEIFRASPVGENDTLSGEWYSATVTREECDGEQSRRRAAPRRDEKQESLQQP